MNTNINTKEIDFKKLVIVVAVVVLSLVFFTYSLLIYNNERNAKRTGEVMLNQMVGVLEDNQSAENTLLESLKEEYTIRAKTVAYMIDHHPEAEYNIQELCKIAELMSIDEIHLFDENGIIYSGTLPEYYGFGFDSGGQISYFKPMLENKTLSMCQNVTPNTAEGKEMMYAISWNSTGDKMIQIGIAPVRLLKELDKNKISNVVNSMPMYENFEIYVADANTGFILGATNYHERTGLSDIGIEFSDIPPNVICYFSGIVDKEHSYCSILKNDKYVICVVQNKSGIQKDTILSMMIIVDYLLISAAVLLMVLYKLLAVKRKQMEEFAMLLSMSEIYYSMHLIDLESNTFVNYYSQNQVEEVISKSDGTDAAGTMREVMCATISDEFLEMGLQFTDLSTLAERLKGRKILFKDMIGKNVGWIRMSFITISADADDIPKKVICTTQIIDEEKRREEYLIKESTTDRLTQCYNRTAYENDMHAYANVPPEENFVFVSIDVNGLKMVNDTLGHAAGDELLLGAAKCIKQCFDDFGKVYRMGGDEFAAVIFADADQLEKLQNELEKTISGWHGKIVDSLSVSCGYAAKKEFPDSSIAEMAEIADERMYSSKIKYYKDHSIGHVGNPF